MEQAEKRENTASFNSPFLATGSCHEYHCFNIDRHGGRHQNDNDFWLSLEAA